MTQLGTPYRSDLRTGRDGCWQVLHAEWTKFRTVRGWAIALVAVAVLTAVMPILLATPAKANDNVTCVRQPGGCIVFGQTVATGPAGDAVTDTFYFVHQPMAEGGSITARVSSLAGKIPLVPPGAGAAPATQPWAKAGLIIKASTRPGSAYAAVMLTGSHGVRMQYNFTGDIAGNGPAAAPAAARWLRLTRAADVITGYESADGRHWTKIGTASLSGLSGTVQVGLFVTSPDFIKSVGSGDDRVDLPTHATAAFDRVSLVGGRPGQSWTGTGVGSAAGGTPAPRVKCGPAGACKGLQQPNGGFTQAGGRYVVGGSGDIAPYEPVVDPLDVAFLATLFGLITVIALGAVFVTAEYRRGLIRTTVTASPRRGRVLLAKAIVIASVTFVAALIGSAIAFHISEQKLIANGWSPPVWPDISLTSGAGLQIVLGTAAIAAGASVLGLAAGAIFRRSAGAVLAVAGVLVIPFILALVLPLTWADWLLRLTPAAAFSLQAGVRHYPQVQTVCAPYHGCFPLAGWDGYAVLAAWVLVALAGGMFLLRRRDT